MIRSKVGLTLAVNSTVLQVKEHAFFKVEVQNFLLNTMVAAKDLRNISTMLASGMYKLPILFHLRIQYQGTHSCCSG